MSLPGQAVARRSLAVAEGRWLDKRTPDTSCSPALVQHANDIAAALKELADEAAGEDQPSPTEPPKAARGSRDLVAEASRFSLDIPKATGLSASLEAGCEPLDPGAASHSNAKLWLTTDGLWVVKEIKKVEALALADIAGFSYAYGRRWMKFLVAPDAASPSGFAKHAPGSATEEALKHSGAVGGLVWESQYCSPSDIEAKLRYCYTESDPKFMYRRHLEEGFSLMVPIVLHMPSLHLVVMPNVRRLAEDTLSTLVSSSPGIALPSLEKYDVKPLQVPRSDERGPFLARLLELQLRPAADETLRCQGLRGVACWTRLVDSLEEDVRFLSEGRHFEFVDYSLVFYIGAADGLLVGEASDVMLPGVSRQCVVSQKAGRSTLLCVHLLDYLMAKTTSRELESWWKNGKFDDYAQGIQHLMFCVGDLNARPCRFYSQAACQHIASTVDTDKSTSSKEAAPPQPDVKATSPKAIGGSEDQHALCRHKPGTAPHCPDPDPAWSQTSGLGRLSCAQLSGKQCLPKHAIVMGFSPRAHRNVSAMEACCCAGLGLAFPQPLTGRASTHFLPTGSLHYGPGYGLEPWGFLLKGVM